MTETSYHCCCRVIGDSRPTRLRDLTGQRIQRPPHQAKLLLPQPFRPLRQLGRSTTLSLWRSSPLDKRWRSPWLLQNPCLAGLACRACLECRAYRPCLAYQLTRSDRTKHTGARGLKVPVPLPPGVPGVPGVPGEPGVPSARGERSTGCQLVSVRSNKAPSE